MKQTNKKKTLKLKEKNSHFPYAKWSWHWDTPGVSGVTELIGKDVQKRWGVYTDGKPQSRGILQSKLLVSNLVSNPLNGGLPNPSDSSVKDGFCFTLHVKKLMITTARAPHHQAQNFISLASSASATKKTQALLDKTTVSFNGTQWSVSGKYIGENMVKKNEMPPMTFLIFRAPCLAGDRRCNTPWKWYPNQEIYIGSPCLETQIYIFTFFQLYG